MNSENIKTIPKNVPKIRKHLEYFKKKIEMFSRKKRPMLCYRLLGVLIFIVTCVFLNPMDIVSCQFCYSCPGWFDDSPWYCSTYIISLCHEFAKPIHELLP